jgi:protein-S-isoprenylcysteine O-methyltransferase Ste14
MPEAIRLSLIVIGLIFVVVGGYYRIQSQRSQGHLVANAARSPPDGVAAFAVAVACLLWMFRTVRRSLTDTVVVRKAGQFVDDEPYRLRH